jgi:hypothetical protein
MYEYVVEIDLGRISGHRQVIHAFRSEDICIIGAQVEFRVGWAENPNTL